MKKFLFVLALMFAANLGCKKMSNVDGLCACSPIQYPSLALVIKGANQIDLLNPSTNGYFASNDIQLYYQEQGGSLKQLKTYIRPPFGYGNNNEKFTYYQLIQRGNIERCADKK